MVTEYKFDGGLRDTGSDGSMADDLTAGNPVDQQGVTGDALICDANTVVAADSADLDLASQYTIEIFIKPASLSGIQYILSKDSYKIGISDSNLFVYHRQSDGTTVGGSTVRPTLNRWQHVAVVASSSTIILYLNGQAVKTFAYNGTILNSSEPLSICGAGGANYYSGLIDEIRMFNTAKTASYVLSRAAYSCGALPQGDADGDCRITISDFYLLAQQWLLCDSKVRTDCQ
jgi:hypothetical protein